FFGLLKQEMYYGEPLTSYKKLKNKINQYIHHLNINSNFWGSHQFLTTF
ncbi:IS3 family transposase, partial [Facklamia miroungae]